MQRLSTDTPEIRPESVLRPVILRPVLSDSHNVTDRKVTVIQEMYKRVLHKVIDTLTVSVPAGQGHCEETEWSVKRSGMGLRKNELSLIR